MDHNSIPACALYRNRGTVILRLKMEVCCGNVCPATCPLLQRTSGCEQCNRTRLISKYSDCDNGVVEKSRTYRCSAARSRYVNACAAICLLLLFGSSSPKSSAAPPRTVMENEYWENPCDYNKSTSQPIYPSNSDKELASKLVVLTRNAYNSAATYKDEFAKELHSYSSFDELLHSWETYDWLKKFDWLPEDAFPKAKVLYQKMPDDYMDQIMQKSDEVLPKMYKGLKMVVAGLHTFYNEGFTAEIISEHDIREKIGETKDSVRGVLCYFSDLMRARQLETSLLPTSEVPNFKTDDRLTTGLLVYRDTLNYLQYLEQFFQKYIERKS